MVSSTSRDNLCRSNGSDGVLDRGEWDIDEVLDDDEEAMMTGWICWVAVSLAVVMAEVVSVMALPAVKAEQRVTGRGWRIFQSKAHLDCFIC